MAKFNKGDKVRVVKGIHEGTTGVVADPWWQVSQSDWPRVEFTTVDGTYFYADEDEMELTEDPYEYAMLCSYRDAEGANPIQEEEWRSRPDAEEILRLFTTGDGGEFYKDRFIFTLVKRRKAGPVEDAT